MHLLGDERYANGWWGRWTLRLLIWLFSQLICEGTSRKQRETSVRKIAHMKKFLPTSVDASLKETHLDHQAKILVEPSDALNEHMDLAFNEVNACPVTFIYDLPEYWDYQVPLSEMANFVKVNEGRMCSAGVRDVNQYSALLRVIYRLMTSRRCILSKDPLQADLFLVPLFPKPKGRDFCVGFRIEDLETHLKYLTTATAHKHFIVLQKGHGWLNSCGNWWRQPDGLLQKVIRLAYSLPWRGRDVGDVYGPSKASLEHLEEIAQQSGDFLNDSVIYPHLYSIPYPSSKELWGTSATYRVEEHLRRPFLLHYSGGLHGKYGLDLRKKILADCEKASKYQCLVHNFATGKNICSALEGKTRSKFCFEPGGDSPYRKSLYDSISLGCVPVLLSPYQLLVAPWHIGHFRNSAMVFLDRDVYLKNEVNIFTFLESLVSTGAYQRMQNALNVHSHAVQYALEDHPGDAVERLLVGVKRASMRYEQAN